MALATIDDLKDPVEVEKWTEFARSFSRNFMYFINGYSRDINYMVNIKGSRSRSGGLHASEISKCPRIPVYSLSNTERKPRATRMRLIFDTGHAFHAMLQHYLYLFSRESGGSFQFYEEVGVHPGIGGAAQEWEIYTSCDGELIYREDPNGPVSFRMGIEIKTESDKQFEKLTKVRKEHLEQVTVYQKCLDLPLMWVFYINKSNQNIKKSEEPFLIPFDSKKWTELENRFFAFKEHAEAGTLPERKEGRHCEWCPFAYACNPSYLQRINKNYTPLATTKEP